MDPKIDDGGPAFPLVPCPGCDNSHKSVHEFSGASLRDYFAAAVAGHIEAEWQRGFGSGDYGEVPPTADQVADRAYEIADAMLKQREARQ